MRTRNLRRGLLFLAAVASALSWLTVAGAQEPRVADKTTVFHRVYVLGDGNAHFLWHEDSSFKDDLDELQSDLEQDKNQHSGSTSKTFTKPTVKELQDYLDDLRDTVEPNEEVTFYFGGHGNVDVIRINTVAGMPVLITAANLAQMLQGFEESVTLVVILDSCFGGSFADDIGESDHVAVIGPSTTCPVDPPSIFGAFTSTITEDGADGAGESEADSSGDEVVTAQELKDWLTGRGWNLGQATGGEQPKKGKSKCFECALPSIVVDSHVGCPGTVVEVLGEGFAADSVVTLSRVAPDLSEWPLGSTSTGSDGSFAVTVSAPFGPSLIVATDATGNEDWELFGQPVGGIAEFLPLPEDLRAEAGAASDGSSSSAPLYGAVAGGAALVVLVLAGAGWYARRRWLQ